MSSKPTLDKKLFIKRLDRLYEFWKNCSSNDPIKKCDCLLLACGNDEVVYSKSLSLQTWLFGYEMNESITLFLKDEIHFLASKKKCDFMSDTDHSTIKFNILMREKTDKDAANHSKLVELITENGVNIGHIAKDKTSGEFISKFKTLLKEASPQFLDISGSVGNLLAVKDDIEVANIRKAADVSNNLFVKCLREQIVDVMNEDKKVKHVKLQTNLEEAVKNKRYNLGLDPDQLDMCYPPIIQSGGKFALKYSSQSDKEHMHFGIIVCMLGVRYKSYCSNIIRTIMVNATDEQQATYNLLSACIDMTIEKLKPGIRLCDVYNEVLEHVRQQRPELEEKMVKNLGFVTGLEFRDVTLYISPKTQTEVRAGMTLVVNVGFENILNPDGKMKEDKTYALFLSDTVLVKEEGPAEALTTAKRTTKGVTMFIKDQEDEESEESEDEAAPTAEEIIGRGHRRAILDTKTRGEAVADDNKKTDQQAIYQAMMQAAKDRLSGKKKDVDDKKKVRSSVAYKNHSQLPKESDIRALRLLVDRRYEALLLPVFGFPTPFHISTVKNVSTSVEGDYTYLRVNFFHPGASIGKENQQFSNPNATFVKEVTFRASNERKRGEVGAPSTNLDTAFRQIKEVQKKFKTREAELREKEDLVAQDTLILSQNRSVPKLKDLYIRPNIVSKRISGNLEAHINGFRFTSIRGDKVDILYNNVKNAFFQPCDKEMIILLHFHLRNAIMFGKKKHYDVQFYTEVGEITTDLGKAHHMHDRDDIEAEQRERELRSKLKQAFKHFTEKVEGASKQAVEFEVPFRQLGFMGAPFRSTVMLQPSTSALVHLTEWPPFVATLNDVELVHFERVSLSIRNFDMVFVFKDYSRKVAMINSIPATSLEHVKEWLSSCDIFYSEGVQSLNWVKVMKTIADDVEGFFDSGGWDFLNPQDSEGEEDMDDDEEDDAYNPSEEESGGEESGSGSSDDEESDWEAEKADKEKEVDEARGGGPISSAASRKRKHSSPSKHSSKKHKHGKSPSKNKSPSKSPSKKHKHKKSKRH